MKQKRKTPRSYKRKADIIENGEIIRLYPLTKVETKIAKLVVGKAMNNKEAAEELGTSVRTIENQRYSLMKKLKTKNAIELTKKVINLGLVKL